MMPMVINPELESRLERWSFWNDHRIWPLSYSSKSHHADWTWYGPVTGHRGDRVFVWARLDNEAAEVDRILADWRDRGDSRYYLVIWSQYRTGEGMTIDQKLMSAGCCKSTFYKRLGTAHEWMAEALGLQAYVYSRRVGHGGKR